MQMTRALAASENKKPHVYSSPPLLRDSARYETLLRVLQVLTAQRDPRALLRVLARELRHVVTFDILGLVIYDEATHTIDFHMLEIVNRPDVVLPPDLTPEETMSWWVYQHQQPLVIPCVDTETRFPRMMALLQQYGMRSVCGLPLTTVHRRLGGFCLSSAHPDAYAEEEVCFLTLVADQVALAIDDALNFEAAQRAQAALQRNNDRLKLLLEVNNSLVSNLELRDLLRAISASVRRVMHCDAASVALPDAEGDRLWLYALDFPDSKGFVQEGDPMPVEGSPFGTVFQTGKPLLQGRPDPDQLAPEVYRIAVGEGFASGCMLPLLSRDRVLGVLSLGRRQEQVFTQDDVDFLAQIASQVAIAVENALAYGEIAALKDQLAQEKLYLEDEIRSEMHFADIVGQSAALRRVLQQVETVAPTDATVLICGETGSGKELIARAIHQLSPRQPHAFVKLNCAAIPSGLLESELFGHEKGAFTGAIAQRIGRFELAHRGTVFLDEIGEMPLEVQPKLLRVLQDREFERLGGSRTLRTDARLIVATNRDLATLVEVQQFRADLFYRVNVFPVQVPPLRQRPEDIPLLVRHFAQQFARRMHKTIETVPSDTMQRLRRYPWPGNIRELQNIIERAVILSPGPVLQVPRTDLDPRVPPGRSTTYDTLAEAERKHMLAVLEEMNWVLGGPHGAAVRLGMKRSTLQFRMRKLGITRPDK
jgi:formate hydrogenlyase transcriptional activator